MGIREYFEKAKLSDEDTKLQEFSLHEVEKQETKFNPDEEILQKDWQEIRKQLTRDRNRNWLNFASMAMSIKILAPDKFLELSIDNNDWQKMKKELEECRRSGSWWPFVADLAMPMKIIAADKVEVIDQGLEITMNPPESFSQTKNPRSKRKTFQ